VTGRCEPAATDDQWQPAVLCWPACAVSWGDGDTSGSTGALLLTAATFGCIAFQAGGSDGGQ
jgi:hypothetical protein